MRAAYAIADFACRHHSTRKAGSLLAYGLHAARRAWLAEKLAARQNDD